MGKSYGIAGLRSLPRAAGGRLMLAVAAAVAVVAAALVVLSPPDAPADGQTEGGGNRTRWGPLSEEDRTLLVKVRQAGLWEMPAGQQAQQRAASPRVKEVAGMIMEQHMRLDADTRATAQRLNVILPTEPNADQKGWLREMSGKFGADYDRTFVLRLRAAHGKVFGVIALVRAHSKNTEIRAFAERAMKFVNNHMRLLESTGLVTDSALH
ncbi:DUF4142 domain-containing protein [Actinomadura macrotermitis]|uniref:DUF4142 domain-containing protein n=1 Tax=Actinomadura macrotermitis TaxID=2585200 RepID=A0A7K0BP46_9ACTN|nr:DUF4142 domain-containing protein [Actinomadura macrotermitis]MQY02474.1 hypothetical protein [Actinomadura macrotermitis]